jgi:hypothetical protein
VNTCKTCKHYREPRDQHGLWYLQPHGRCTWGETRRKVPLWWQTSVCVRDPDREHQCQSWEERK